MKKKIFRWIFKKELNEVYAELNDCYNREVRRVENEMENNKKKYGLMEKIFFLYPEAEIIGIEKNKNEDELIIVLYDDSILLFGEKYQGYGALPRILFRISTKEINKPESKYIHIQDVLMVDNNIGNGTVAMKALIKYAKKIKAMWIDGELSAVDDDHADRRDHYYEKFGFTIKDAYIYLDLRHVDTREKYNI